jgi:hypothetical protein
MRCLLHACAQCVCLQRACLRHACMWRAGVPRVCCVKTQRVRATMWLEFVRSWYASERLICGVRARHECNVNACCKCTCGVQCVCVQHANAYMYLSNVLVRRACLRFCGINMSAAWMQRAACERVTLLQHIHITYGLNTQPSKP